MFNFVQTLIYLFQEKFTFIRMIFSVLLIIGATVFYILTHKNSVTSEIEEIFDDPNPKTLKWTSNEEIQILRRYLRFPTISLSGNFGEYL